MLILAILPAIVLFFFVWKSDRTEKEPPKLLIKLFLLGMATIATALIIGLLGDKVFSFMDPEGMLFIFIDNFILTALVEEGGKYFVLKKVTWKHPAFTHTFDAIVYAVAVSLGFATLENIIYVLDGDVGTAFVRAIFSVPGHVTDAVYMGYYFGTAKYAEKARDMDGCRKNLWKAIIIPVLLHGFYDFCLSTQYDIFILIFLIFEVVMTALVIRRILKSSKYDRHLPVIDDPIIIDPMIENGAVVADVSINSENDQENIYDSPANSVDNGILPGNSGIINENQENQP